MSYTGKEHIGIARLSCEHYESPLGIDCRHSKPRLSWRFAGNAKDWLQVSYTLEVTFARASTETYQITSSDSVLVPWPSRPFKSRDSATVRVRATGVDGSSTAWSEPITIEAALFQAQDWKSVVLSGESQPSDAPKRPQCLRTTFNLPSSPATSARIYATAFGCYELFLNGSKVSEDLLAPGWQSYTHRHHYQTYDVTDMLVSGPNFLGATVGEGWYATRLNFGGGRRNIYGEDIGVMLQLEVDDEVVVSTQESEGWEWSYGPILSSEIYDGEVYDSRLQDSGWATSATDSVSSAKWSRDVRSLGLPKGRLIAAECPPVRVTSTLQAKELITTPSGKKILDFGENVVGRVRIEVEPALKEGGELLLSHAEVLEHGELGTRPLRQAKAQAKIIGGGSSLVGYTPTFTFYGFRFLQVDGWPDLDLNSVVVQVIHTDMERTGWFECSHPLINQLHSNVIRSLRGNMVSVPTDCPQRDERLGWTGDLQVFAPTANFLYDTSSTLSGWLQDLAEEQILDYDSVVPLVVPNTLDTMFGPPPPSAIWGDVAVLTPNDLYTSFGDTALLEQQYESMKAWLDEGVKRDDAGLLWSDKLMQFGDWLDPKAPHDAPWEGRTDNILAANAWLVHTTGVMADVCGILGKKEDEARYRSSHARLVAAFQREYITPAGRIMSDSQGALAMGLSFNLIPSEHIQTARKRLEALVRKAIFKVSTGFAATPLILHVLSDNDLLPLAYRMLQEGGCPSWLYPVTMGATTIWERWDSMLPNGEINPGEMTSFNHYALGSVASWMHRVIGGLSPLQPGWKEILVKPRPGGSVESAFAEHLSPYGSIRCEWKVVDNDTLHVVVEVPPNCSAVVELGGGRAPLRVGSGVRVFDVPYTPDPSWPPAALQMPFGPPKPDVPL